MAAPTPLPTAVKKRRGTYRADRASANEAQPFARKPNCPRWLGPEAKREWRRMAKHLHDAGLLTFIDRAALAAYCEAYGHWKEATLALRKQPTVIESDKGNLYLNPWWGVMRTARTDMMAALREFGMTPSARSKIVVARADEEADDLASELWGLIGD